MITQPCSYLGQHTQHSYPLPGGGRAWCHGVPGPGLLPFEKVLAAVAVAIIIATIILVGWSI